MQQNATILQRLLLFGLLFGLILLGFEVLKYFIVPVVWATIITYITWPIYLRIYRMTGRRKNISALLMTVLIVLIVGVPLIAGGFLLQQEARSLIFTIQNQVASGKLITIPDFVKNLPMVGKEIQRVLIEFNQNPKVVPVSIADWLQGHVGYGRIVLAEVSKNLAKFGLVILSLFFFYRDGNAILKQVRTAFTLVIGERVPHYFQTISETTRAVVYGVGLTAVAQALLAGLSYAVAGAKNPMVLTLLTFVFALIPFGTPVAYTGVALWLYSQGHMVEAIGVMVWGVVIVSSSDNVIRPLVISGATKIPFLLIMFGVLGGISSFGLVGVFIGPVLLAILLACWREWLQQHAQDPIVIETQLHDEYEKIEHQDDDKKNDI